MHVSINTAVFLTALQKGVSQSDCIQSLATSAIDAIEVRGEFFDVAHKAEELTKIADFCQQHALGFYYSVPETLFTKEGLNPSLAANLMMAERYHIQGLKYSFGPTPNLGAQAIASLKAILNQTHVQVTIENQPNPDGALSTFTANLDWVAQQQLPLGYTFDAGNWYWIDEAPEQAFETLKDRITVFHLKDIQAQDTVLLGEGQTDWQMMVQALAPKTPIFLEYAIDPAALNGQIQLVNNLMK